MSRWESRELTPKRSPVPVCSQRSGCPGGRESLGAYADAIAKREEQSRLRLSSDQLDAYAEGKISQRHQGWGHFGSEYKCLY
jgi:hypothetical protein